MRSRAVSDQLASVFRAFDAQDVPTLVASVTEDVQLRLGNAPMTQGRAAFIDAVNVFRPARWRALTTEILDVYSDGDVAVVEFAVHLHATRREVGHAPALQRVPISGTG